MKHKYLLFIYLFSTIYSIIPTIPKNGINSQDSKKDISSIKYKYIKNKNIKPLHFKNVIQWHKMKSDLKKSELPKEIKDIIIKFKDENIVNKTFNYSISNYNIYKIDHYFGNLIKKKNNIFYSITHNHVEGIPKILYDKKTVIECHRKWFYLWLKKECYNINKYYERLPSDSEKKEIIKELIS